MPVLLPRPPMCYFSIVDEAPRVTPQKIAVRMPNWLGDVVMAIPFVRALERRFPDASIDLIMAAGVETVPLRSRGEILVYDRRVQSAGAFGSSLRGRAYDRFYVLPPSFSAAWMAFRAGARERIGYRGDLRGFLLNRPIAPAAPPRSRHLAAEFLTLLDAGLAPEDLSATFSIDDDWIRHHWPAAIPPASGFVALAFGAKYGPAKKWPGAYARELVQRLLDAGEAIVLVGTASDRIFDASEPAPAGVTDACGRTSLPEMIALLARSRLVVSNDSGAMHVAAALGRPQVAVFGSTSPAWTGPLNPRARLLYAGLDCSPCFERTCPLGHTNCLKQISPDHVMKAVRDIAPPSAPTRPPPP